MKKLNQRGFTLIEVLVVCTLLGVLATIAVPRFTKSVTLANTAKVQADLQVLDAAIIMYATEYGTEPSSLSDLKEYVTDIENLKPPKGKCKLKNGKVIELSDTAYTIADAKETEDAVAGTQKRAMCGGMTAGAFGK